MENKRGTKRERSPSVEGSPLPDDAETSPPTPPGSLPPPGSLSVASSCRPCSLVFKKGNASPCSLVFKKGNASGKIPMLEPSSFIVDTSRDEEIARKLFGDLHRDILGPSGDGKIIIIDDSDDNDEVQEETTAEIESTVAATSANDASAEARIDNSDDQGPDQEADGGDNSGHNVDDP
jgi:hypothetical protein